MVKESAKLRNDRADLVSSGRAGLAIQVERAGLRRIMWFSDVNRSPFGVS